MDARIKNALLPVSALNIAQKCATAAAAMAATFVVGAGTDDAKAVPTTPAETVNTTMHIAADPSSEGALLLELVERDPLTGELVAYHYSHASHSSHSSHSSHYSSRF